MNPVEQFQKLFTGLQRGYGILLSDGNYRYVKGQPTTRLYQQHLEGKISLGIVPITDKGNCRFGALDLDDQGNLGVKIVNSTGLVEFISAEVISSDSTGVWLSGLPQTASIITVGHQFVQAGDLVEVVADVESTD